MSTKLLLGIHCHQPVDNFSYVVDEATIKSYLPFLKCALESKNFKFSIHYSGWLLEYIKKYQGECFELLVELAKRGSVEFFTGGYYEPILASIPSQDRVGQIKLLSDFIYKNFNQIPKGLWLTERVWEDMIIRDLKKCGIEYVVVDDYHFLCSGFEDNELNGYYLTEDGGESIALFPIDKNLRYKIPFREVDDVLDELMLPKYQNGAGVIFDDGEKFGIWPKTYEWVYEKGWLREFMQKIQKNGAIESLTFGEYFQSSPPKGLAYLPTCSYFEMGEWSLQPKDSLKLEELSSSARDDLKIFAKGGIWKNFLSKYKESNRIHKRAMEISAKAKKINKKSLKDSLYRAQTNDVLWHGVFGGIYLPNLRDNAYKYIIQSENEIYKDVDETQIEVEDFNLDGHSEIKFITKSLIAIFETKEGGSLGELSLRDELFNYQNTLCRRKEAYHHKIELQDRDHHDHAKSGIDTIHSMDSSKLEELKEHLKFDRTLKNSFIDHICDYSLVLENFDNQTFKEYGDFSISPYLIKEKNKELVKLQRDGKIGFEKSFSATFLKSFKVKNSRIEFELDLNSFCDYMLQYLLELNFHFANLDDIEVDGKKFENSLFIEDVQTLEIYDKYLNRKVVLKIHKPISIFVSRVDSVSQSESGFELTNQALSIGVILPFIGVFSLSGSLEIV